MDNSVLIYRNHQNAEMEVYGLQIIVYLMNHKSPEEFLQMFLTSFVCQWDNLDDLYI